MIFTDIELDTIIKVLGNNTDTNWFVANSIISKLNKIRGESINKRYSLRTTDWLVENGRKSARNRKRKKVQNVLF